MENLNNLEQYYGIETTKLVNEGARIDVDVSVMNTKDYKSKISYKVSLSSYNGKTLFSTTSTKSLVASIQSLERKIIRKYKEEETDEYPFKKLCTLINRQREISFGNKQFQGWQVRYQGEKIVIYIYKAANPVISFDVNTEYMNVSLNLCNIPFYKGKEQIAFLDVLKWVREYLDVPRETRLKELSYMRRGK